MGVVVPRGWRNRAFRPEEVSASENSDRKVLAALDAETTNSHKNPENKSENWSTGCSTTGTSHHCTDSPPMRAPRRSALSWRAKPANA